MHPPSSARLGAVGLVARSFRLLFGRFGFLFPLAFVPQLALGALSLALAPPATPGMEAVPGTAAGAMAVLLLTIVTGVLVSGVTGLAALDAALGKRHSLGDYLRQTLRHFGALAVLSLLFGIAVGVGLVFLIVPGLYVVARFLPYTQAVVFENAGWSGLARAQELTEGYRWHLVGANLLIGLSLLAIALAFGPVLVVLSGSAALELVANAVLGALVTLLPAIYGGLAYLRLREIKEGASEADVAASID